MFPICLGDIVSDLIKLNIQHISKPTNGPPVCFLALRSEERNPRFVVMMLGPHEVGSIVYANHPGIKPNSHDLLLDFVDQLGGEIDSVEVRELKDNVLMADVFLDIDDDENVKLDARMQDAIALCIRTKAPIFITDELLGEIAQENHTEIDRKEEPWTPVTDKELETLSGYTDFVDSLSL